MTMGIYDVSGNFKNFGNYMGIYDAKKARRRRKFWGFIVENDDFSIEMYDFASK